MCEPSDAQRSRLIWYFKYRTINLKTPVTLLPMFLLSVVGSVFYISFNHTVFDWGEVGGGWGRIWTQLIRFLSLVFMLLYQTNGSENNPLKRKLSAINYLILSSNEC